jgi:monoamine oxidase
MAAYHYDTVILGAGMAGLAAGRMLAESGTQVALLEARNRVGGRVRTEHIATRSVGGVIAVELGAEFVHGLPPQTWTLLREASLATYELSGAHLRFADGRLQTLEEQGDGVTTVLERMTQWLAAQPPDTDATFAEYLRRTSVGAADRQSAIQYVESFNAADSNVIGVAALAKQQYAEDQIESDRLFRVREGYDALPKFLAANIEQAGGVIHLDTTVQRIVWQRGVVDLNAVDGSGGVFNVRARRAIITLPLGVLQAGTVEFAPAPGDILAHARRMAMGAVVRVTLVFESLFWRHLSWSEKRTELKADLEQLSFLFTRDELPATWWTAMPDTAPTITGWIGGPKVAELERRIKARGTPDALLTQCLNALARVFDVSAEELQRLLVSWHTHDWQSDQCARGAYSYAPSGALDASEKMTRTVDGTLYFAGEHTDISGHRGTVHGALASGIRAAIQLMANP